MEETLGPPGAGNELVCAQLTGDLNGKWVPNAGHLGKPKRQRCNEKKLICFISPAKALEPKVDAKTRSVVVCRKRMLLDWTEVHTLCLTWSSKDNLPVT